MNKVRKENIGHTEGIFERKFIVPYRYKRAFLSTLRHGARAPVRFAESRLKTVYFDDDDFESYWDSADGYLLRRKFRFREYCNIKSPRDGARYSIEVKVRYNMAVIKEKQLIYHELPEDYFPRTFQDAIWECEKAEGRPLEKIRAHMHGKTLFPDIMVAYTRHRFVDKKYTFRYNFDTDIVIHRISGRRTTRGVFRPGYHIFEVKGPGEGTSLGIPMPFVLEPLSRSKYMWAKELFH